MIDLDPSEIQKKEAEMREAIGGALLSWSRLEDSLARGFDYLIRTPYGVTEAQPPFDLGRAIYYAATNLETRFAIVDTTFCRTVPFYAHGRAITRCWIKLLERFGRAKKPRNQMAHGHLNWWFVAPHGKHQLRIAWPHYWDEPSIEEPPFPSLEEPKPLPKPQYPGMSINEVRATENKFKELHQSTQMIFNLVAEVRKVPFDWKTSRYKLLELGYRLNLKREELIGQNPPMPEDPPEPSQA